MDSKRSKYLCVRYGHKAMRHINIMLFVNALVIREQQQFWHYNLKLGVLCFNSAVERKVVQGTHRCKPALGL